MATVSDKPLDRAMAAVVTASERFAIGSSIRNMTYAQRKAVVVAVIESLRVPTDAMVDAWSERGGYYGEFHAGAWAAVIDVVLEK